MEFEIIGAPHRMVIEGKQVFCARTTKVAKIKKILCKVVAIQAMSVGVTLEHAKKLSRDWGNVAVSNALSMEEYGDYEGEACRKVLSWLRRGTLEINPSSAAATFIPRSCLGGTMVINQVSPFTLCRNMMYARTDCDLFWIPGDGLPPFKLRRTTNETISPTEIEYLPEGAEPCSANVQLDFI